jgi:hypothetical protein
MLLMSDKCECNAKYGPVKNGGMITTNHDGNGMTLGDALAKANEYHIKRAIHHQTSDDDDAWSNGSPERAICPRHEYIDIASLNNVGRCPACDGDVVMINAAGEPTFLLPDHHDLCTEKIYECPICRKPKTDDYQWCEKCEHEFFENIRVTDGKTAAEWGADRARAAIEHK